MAGSTFQPPVHIDPTQDNSSQISFINQNFQSLGAALETSTFRIVQSGTMTMTAIVNQGSYGLVTHNLGDVPMVIATCVGPLFPNSAAMVPYISFPDTTGKIITSIVNITTTVVQFGVELGSATAGAAGTWTFKYWLLQQTAT